MDPKGPRDPFSRPEVQWGFGCLMGLTAVTGLLILLLLVAYVLQPPTWLQILLGVGLTVGGAIFAWLVASALGQSRSSNDPARRSVDPGSNDPGTSSRDEDAGSEGRAR